jgi:hypothetical protein
MGQEAQPAPAPDAFQQASNAAARTLQQPNIGKGVAIGVGIAVGVAALGKIMSSRERS